MKTAIYVGRYRDCRKLAKEKNGECIKLNSNVYTSNPKRISKKALEIADKISQNFSFEKGWSNLWYSGWVVVIEE